MKKEFFASNKIQWRDWLQQHHDSENEVWLVYFKKGVGKSSIGYMDSVEEALCFGWIDGIKKRIDERRYAHRFTPRRPGSKWSDVNIRRANKLIREGRMTKTGLLTFQQRSDYSREVLTALRQKEIQLPSEIEKSLKGNCVAWKNFGNLAAGYKKQYIVWLTMAKKPETKAKRLQEAIRLLEKNQKLGMK
jgi:uncharacterized protein YdeI (YjbR/CyaY-like superfamily)